jgi:hypothetical protein
MYKRPTRYERDDRRERYDARDFETFHHDVPRGRGGGRAPRDYDKPQHEPERIRRMMLDKIHGLQHTIVYNSFVDMCRMVFIRNIFIGYSSVPDGSIVYTVLTMKQALDDLQKYVSDDKQRLSPIPIATLIPKDAVAGVHYFNLFDNCHVRAIWWSIVRSYATVPDDLKAIPVLADAFCDAFRRSISVCSVIAEDGEHRMAVWPSLFYSSFISSTMTLRILPENPFEMYTGTGTQGTIDARAIERPWTVGLFRGNARDYGYAYAAEDAEPPPPMTPHDIPMPQSPDFY